MNEMRRKVLRSCIRAASQAKSSEELELVVEDLRSIMEEEEESRENLPENLLSSDRYYDSEAASDLMEQAMECYEEAMDLFEEGESEKRCVLIREANGFLTGIPRVN